MATLRKIIRHIFTLPILLYQKVISPALPPSCIYEPTCSHYATKAIMKHGIVKGILLGIPRIFRCLGGLYTGGKDEVPVVFSFRAIGEGYRTFWRGRRK
ncbi:MAG: membrane protein insertion efficiency factor YidD [Spirochaetales bacterium]|nr:membrane protein insertion efficiency factor YidD [Spirochaetales bacterium]